MRSEFLPDDLAREDVWVDDKGLIHYRRTTNNAPVINANIESKKDPMKGFTKERMFQHLARIPNDVFHAWALKIGYYQMDKEHRRIERFKFLKENPQWLVVERQVTPTPQDTHVIIK